MAAAAAAVTPLSRMDGVQTILSAMARGVGLEIGYVGVTYSGTGGMTWSGPFTNNYFVGIAPASNYLPLVNGGQLKIYLLSTATMSEAASDVDFTQLTGGGFPFMAFGT